MKTYYVPSYLSVYCVDKIHTWNLLVRINFTWIIFHLWNYHIWNLTCIFHRCPFLVGWSRPIPCRAGAEGAPAPASRKDQVCVTCDVIPLHFHFQILYVSFRKLVKNYIIILLTAHSSLSIKTPLSSPLFISTLHCALPLSLSLCLSVSFLACAALCLRWEPHCCCLVFFLLSSASRMQLSTMKLQSLTQRVSIWTPVGWAEPASPRALSSERRHPLIKSKAWPTRRVVAPAFGMSLLKFPVLSFN